MVCSNCLADEPLLLLSVPPTSSLNYLTDGRMVISCSHIKSKVIGTLLWLDVLVFLIQDSVQFLHELDVQIA